MRHVTEVPGSASAHPPYSHAVVAGAMVYVSGQIAVRPGGAPTEVVGPGIEAQTAQALRNVVTVLEAAGSSADHIVKITVLLARPEDARGMNQAYSAFFPGARPARSIARLGVEVPGVLISIDAIAQVG